MKLRTLTAAIGIPLILAFVYFDFSVNTAWFTRVPLLILLVGAATILGAIEFYRLGSYSGARPLTVFGVVWSALLVVAALFDIPSVTACLLASAVVFPLLWEIIFHKDIRFPSWGWTVTGILYMGWMLSHYVLLRQLDHGRELVILALFTTFACDTSAFLIGRAYGKHHMAPTISPHKTWEGAIAGLAGAIAAAVALRFLLNLGDWSLPLSYSQATTIGWLIGIGAQLGDLLESLLKRRAGVKDSGNLIPGHGGILDRIDSLVFTGVIVYYFVIWVVE